MGLDNSQVKKNRKRISFVILCFNDDRVLIFKMMHIDFEIKEYLSRSK